VVQGLDVDRGDMENAGRKALIARYVAAYNSFDVKGCWRWCPGCSLRNVLGWMADLVFPSRGSQKTGLLIAISLDG